MLKIAYLLITVWIIMAESSCPKYCQCHAGFEVFSMMCSLRQLQNTLHTIPNTTLKLELYIDYVKRIGQHDFETLINLRYLWIEAENLHIIHGRAFKSLIALHELHIRKTKLDKISDDMFANLFNLKTLSIILNSKLSEITNQTFSALRNIKKLDLSQNSLRNVPKGLFSNLFQLNKLLLESNRIRYIHEDSFKDLYNLTILSLNRNYIKRVNRKLFSLLYNLEILDLSYNRIESCNVDSFVNLHHLTFLNLGNNNLNGKLSSSIFKSLLLLESLFLDGNNINEIQVELINHLKFLKYFSLDRNKITLLPSDLFIIHYQLEVLRLDGNRISFIHKYTFKNLKNLEILTLAKNQLTYLDIETFSPLTQLRKLSLSHMEIEVFKQNLISKLINLEMLYLGFTNLTVLNKYAFANLTRLRFLYLNDNQVKTLPHDIFSNLRYLVRLHLENNQLSELHPALFENNKRIRYLRLDGNNIISIYPALIGITFLQQLDLRGNQLACSCFLNNILRSLKSTGYGIKVNCIFMNKTIGQKSSMCNQLNVGWSNINVSTNCYLNDLKQLNKDNRYVIDFFITFVLNNRYINKTVRLLEISKNVSESLKRDFSLVYSENHTLQLHSTRNSTHDACDKTVSLDKTETYFIEVLQEKQGAHIYRSVMINGLLFCDERIESSRNFEDMKLLLLNHHQPFMTNIQIYTKKVIRSKSSLICSARLSFTFLSWLVSSIFI